MDAAGPTNRRIYLAGSDNGGQLTVIRYSTNGALDTSFNGSGIAVSNFRAVANALIRSGSGGIVAVGQAFESGDFALLRLDASGLPDPTFDQDGFRLDDAGGGGAFASSVALQPDGRLIVAGRTTSTTGFAVARLEPDGRLDVTFDGDGKLRADLFATGLREGRALALQPDGKILIAGAAIPGNGDFALVRLHQDGAFDSSFDADGIATTPVGPGVDMALAMALQGDGKIVVAGRAQNGFNQDVALVRYNSDGSLDTTFDFDGRVFTALGTGDDEAHAVAMQPDGKIVIGGFAVNGPKQLLLARFHPNGSIDASFGQGGVVRTTISAGDAEINALALAPNGSIVVAGQCPSPRSIIPRRTLSWRAITPMGRWIFRSMATASSPSRLAAGLTWAPAQSRYSRTDESWLAVQSEMPMSPASSPFCALTPTVRSTAHSAWAE